MKTLWLLRYNNYYNRIVKKEADLSAYQKYQVKYNGQTIDENGNTAVLQGVNFFYSDFVNTTQVVNWAGDLPDYLLVINESQAIESRWFVVGAEKNRGGQLTLTLHRDLVMDNYDALLDADMFVQKATLPASSPLIYNSEDMSFNQIKRQETLISDRTKCPWIVFYGDQKTRLQSTISVKEGNISVTYNSPSDFQESNIYKLSQYHSRLYSQDSIRLYRWFLYFSLGNSNDPNWEFFYDFPSLELLYTRQNPAINTLPIKTTYSDSSTLISAYQRGIMGEAIIRGANMLLQDTGIIANQYSALLPSSAIVINEVIYNEVNSLANQIIRVRNAGPNNSDKYYRVIATPYSTLQYEYTTIEQQDVWNIVKNSGYNLGAFLSPNLQPTVPTNRLEWTASGYRVSLEEINVTTTEVDIQPMSYTKDAPYNVYCIPYPKDKSVTIKNSQYPGFSNTEISGDFGLSVMKQLILDYAEAGAIYDAQILPYCPLRSTIVEESDETINIDLNNSLSDEWVPIAASDGTTLGYVLRVAFSSFNAAIQLDNPIVIENAKIENATDLYRLCSPNFSSIFEFSAAKNDGISGFVISCTYKPFTPYIKIRPDFKGLYGSDFDDSRGLILGGDYSLPMTTDAWSTYEMQNKNYQASFDRQIHSMEINNSIARRQERWQVAAGVVSAATSGGMTGAIVGGGVGAAVGAVGAGTLSLIGGLKDIEYNEKLRQEAMSLAKDQFGYQLGNIQALPISLSKTTAYNIDNKYFPFLEYYTATDEEKLALANKIRNNGMTVGVIAKWRDFVENTWSYSLEGYEELTDRGYFKARLISIIGLSITSHLAEAIANEFFQGVYLR